jgi:hypothetical protein
MHHLACKNRGSSPTGPPSALADLAAAPRFANDLHADLVAARLATLAGSGQPGTAPR